MKRRGGTVDMTGLGAQVAASPKFKRTARLAVEQRVEMEKQDMNHHYPYPY